MTPTVILPPYGGFGQGYGTIFGDDDWSCAGLGCGPFDDDSYPCDGDGYLDPYMIRLLLWCIA